MKKSTRKVVEPGTKFHNLTVLDSESYSTTQYKKKKALWLVRCDCGKEYKVLGNNVMRGLSKSCGCAGAINEQSILKRLFNGYKTDAKRRNYSFRLTFKGFKKLIERNCYYCKAEPSSKAFKDTPHIEVLINGIDRLNNNSGYVSGNCVPCCSVCNKMKGTLSFASFMEKIESIKNRSCGDDYNTLSTYVSEKTPGDVMKVILLGVYDLVEKFNLQKSEVKALLNDLVEEHILEEDLIEKDESATDILKKILEEYNIGRPRRQWRELMAEAEKLVGNDG